MSTTRTARIAATLAAVAATVGVLAACDPSELPEPGSAASISADAQTQDADPNLSGAQEQAVRKAKQYLDTSAFSQSGLVKQLEFEGFSTADATFAVDYLQPNWVEQAKKKAGEYMSTGSFSQDGLQQQLEFEGFTPEQAQAGAASQF